jgi:hypothetical protein
MNHTHGLVPYCFAEMKLTKTRSLDDDMIARNNIDDVAHCGKNLHTLSEDSENELYRYYRYVVITLCLQIIQKSNK